MDKIMVSISCMAYNHEKYIAEALDSFLMQKTNFKYEVLVHDDASTDKTAKIISEYEEKYPEIIKPIYQKENQHSKKIKISFTYNYPRAKGKYIAVCEGDDYWTDPLKLQKQVDYMELHPECSLCTHAAEKISPDGKLIGYVRPYIGNKSFSVEEVIYGGGSFFPTNSMLFQAIHVKIMPAFYNNSTAGDYPLSILLALKGDVYYIDCYMSIYRYMAEGSWTKRMSLNTEARLLHTERVSKMLRELDEYAGYKYSDVIREKILLNEFMQLKGDYDIKGIKVAKYKKLYSKLSVMQRAKIYVGAYFPCVINLRRKIN